MTDRGASCRGMILAAGYGTRLAPITDHAAKPLLPVAGRPLIDRALDSLAGAGISEVAVNVHHLADQVSAHLARRPDAERITVFPESEILGTGGALFGAREFLAAADRFLLHNGDVLCDADLGALLADHDRHRPLATLLLVDWPAVNTVHLGAAGAVTDLAGRRGAPARSGERALTYSGIGVFSSALLQDIGPGFSSLIDPLLRAMAARPGSVRGCKLPGVRWDDLGTLPRWLAAQPPDAGSTAPEGPVRLERITGHGSDRRFWRLGVDGWSAVAMQSPPGDEEFDRQVAIGGFLVANGIDAPRLLSVHERQKVLLYEDLGSERLYERVLAGADALPDYRDALDLLVRLQSLTPAAQRDCPEATDRCLDEKMLRWETNYFRERFLQGHAGLEPERTAVLEDDFQRLATCVAAQPLVLIHRDFQAQNLHRTVRGLVSVDFQGMRLGPAGYDAAALIFDPYVDLGAGARVELLDRFAAAAAASSSTDDHRDMVLAAALQRLMQALGAYGFLGHAKGKREFLAHIPAGLARLDEVLGLIAARPGGPRAAPGLPALMEILGELA